MIRILQVVSSLNINAGMMSVVMNYYRHIDRNRIQFDFLYFEKMKDNHHDEIIKMGGRTYFLPYPSFNYHYQKQLRHFFAEHRGEYCAVHCHPIWASEIIAREAKRSGIKHVIQHCHSTRYSSKKMSAIRNKALMSVVGFFATDYAACSEEAALLFGKNRVEQGKVTIVRNAIDFEEYKYSEKLRKEFRDDFGISDSTFVIGSVGRLCREKNQKYIIDIFNEYHRKNADSILILVGGGGMKSELEEYAHYSSAKNSIIFTGKRSDIQRVLSGFDVFLMPSLFEGVPLSAVEAQANGLQVLLSDTITKSIKTNRTVYLSLEKSVEEWASQLDTMRFAKYDREDIRELSELGFDIKREAKSLQEYYLSMGTREV